MGVYWWMGMPFVMIGVLIFGLAMYNRERYYYVVHKRDGTKSSPMSLRAARRYNKREKGLGVFFYSQWKWADEEEKEGS